jgi:hypothetical protein
MEAMLSDDVFRNKLQQTIASLEYWTGDIASAARIERAETDTAWRLCLMPEAPNACPLELILRADQHFDITVGDETYEDQRIESLDLFLPLLKAVSGGQVVTRTWRSAATDQKQETETIVTLADGRVWQGRANGAVQPNGDRDLRCDRHYVPYVRRTPGPR